MVISERMTALSSVYMLILYERADEICIKQHRELILKDVTDNRSWKSFLRPSDFILNND